MVYVLGVEKEFVLGLFPVELMNPKDGPKNVDKIMDCDGTLTKIGELTVT